MQNREKKTAWISAETDFEELRCHNQFDEMVRLSEENFDLLVSLCRRSETEALEKCIRFGTVMLSYFERTLDRSKEEGGLFWAGKLKGCLETLDKLQFASRQDQIATERAKLLGTRHLNDIVFLLETHGSLSQSELGEMLGLQASTLSEVLKKVRQTQLIQSSPFGKYRIYSLTEEGVRYGAILRRKKRFKPMLKEPLLSNDSINEDVSNLAVKIKNTERLSFEILIKGYDYHSLYEHYLSFEEKYMLLWTKSSGKDASNAPDMHFFFTSEEIQRDMTRATFNHILFLEGNSIKNMENEVNVL